jgi:glycopeptide antibiotics resistance protein
VLIAVVTLRPTGGGNQVELVPFASDIVPAIVHPLAHRQALVEIGNILLFMPLGAAFRLRRAGWRASVLAGALVSASVEIAQLHIGGRTTSVDDVIVNACGTGVGWLAARLVGDRTARSSAGGSPRRT